MSLIKLYSYQEPCSKILNEFLKGKITKENFIPTLASFIKKRLSWTKKLILKNRKKKLVFKRNPKTVFSRIFFKSK